MPPAPQIRPDPIRFSDFELDVRRGQLRKNGVPSHLQEQCLQILKMLLAHPGEVVTREDLRARLWPNGTVVEFDHGVNAAVMRLREALGDSAGHPKFIETVPRRGYRFIAPVKETGGAEVSALATSESTSEPAWTLEPERFDHYDVIGKIGAGATGVVYRARDRRLGREVAVKVLLSLHSSEPQALRRFRHETLATIALNHPNIVAVYDVGEADGVPYIVTELLQGKTLRERMEQEHLSHETATEYAIQILRGLATAHEAGIVHRDLKPENIVITKDDCVKILDFGLAKHSAVSQEGPEALTGSTECTSPGVMLGTVGYMAPEQVRGEAVDLRSDLFGFGTVFYEMLTGKRAFAGTTAVDTLSSILNSEPEELHSGKSAIPTTLQAVLRRCLEKLPDRRFQSAREVLEALKEKASVRWRVPAKLWRWAALVVLAVSVGAAGSYMARRIRPMQSQTVYSESSTALDAYQKGREYLHRYDKKGNVEKATSSFEAAVKSDPKFALAYAGLGDAYWIKYRLGKDPKWIEQGLVNAKQALELNGGLAAVHVTLGRNYWAKGDQQLAQNEFGQALRMDPLDADAHIGLGSVYEKQGRAADAEAELRKATDLRPDYWIAHNELGTFYRRQGRNNESAQQLRAALEVVPDNAGVHTNLALALRGLGQEKEAEAELKRALELDPTYHAYNNLAVFYFYQRRFTESVEMTEAALKLNDTDYRTWLTLAIAYEWIGEHEKAQAAYARELTLLEPFVKANSREHTAHADLGVLYARQQHRDRALAQIQSALALAPDDRQVLASAGEVYETLGDRTKALIYMKKAQQRGWTIQDGETNPDLRSFMADKNVRRALKASSGKGYRSAQ
ncbi:MAG TPA: protein kinase [Terriglobales bacterium]|nr:protein kinase [Terriglobales bacterium]